MTLRVVRESSRTETYGELGERKLATLCRELGLGRDQASSAQGVLRLLGSSFRERPVHAGIGWPSDITDDHSPFEISVAVDGDRTNIRVLVEAQDERMSEHRGWEPALELNRRLAREPGVELSRFEAVRDLFEPDPRVEARFSLWHAAVVSDAGPPLYKVYLNPQVLGPTLAPGLTRQMLERLDVADAWASVQELMAVASGSNELLYIALDLQDSERARLKVYVAHHGVRAGALEEQLTRFDSYEAGYATWLLRRLSTGDGPFEERPVLTCLGFAAGRAEPDVTLHFPARCYVGDDAQMGVRLAKLLGSERGERLIRAVEAYGERDLEAGRGLMTYVSLRRGRVEETPRLVVYLSPEAHEVQPPIETGRRRSGRAPAMTLGDASLLRSLAHVDVRKERLLEHPFIELLETSREEEDVAVLTGGLSFFVLAFQDVLRLAAERVKDPILRPIAVNHYREDAGHEQWFLHDAAQLGVEMSVQKIFSSQHQLPRDVGYELVAEVIHAQHDVERLAVVFALEGTGDVFFERVISLLERCNKARDLRYFGRHHQDVERSHAVFEQGLQAQLAEVETSAIEQLRIRATIDRVFDQMERLATHLYQEIMRHRERRLAATS